MNTVSSPSSGIIPLTEWELLQVQGRDAVSFLQGQLSCDVTTANTQDTLLGCYCNLQGRMQAAFRLFQHQEDILLLLPTGMASTMHTALQPYAVFSKVTLTPNPSDLKLLGGLGTSFDSISTDAAIQTISLPDDPQRLLWIGSNNALTALQENLTHSFPCLPTTTWRLQDIIHGIANVFPTTLARWLPHRVNYHLAGGISFTKGCFLGQEVIARLHYRGQLKHHAYRIRLHVSLPIAAGAPIMLPTTDAPVGYIVDSVMDSPQTQQALIIWPAVNDKPTTLTFAHQTCTVEWLSLPYAIS